MKKTTRHHKGGVPAGRRLITHAAMNRPIPMTASYAAELPLLTQDSPACWPLVKLWDTATWAHLNSRHVKRQVEALCTRCALKDRCDGIV